MPGRKGRGELQMRLAFQSSPGKTEPDFVGPGIALSVKYTGANGTGDVQSGEKDDAIIRLIGQMKVLLGVPSLNSVTPERFGAMIDESLAQLTPREARKLLSSLKEVVNGLKLAVCQEGGANGIMMSDDSGFYYVPPTDALTSIKIYMIKSEIRIRFYGPKNNSSLHLNLIIDEKLKNLNTKTVRKVRQGSE
jgi:hypothetical protein